MSVQTLESMVLWVNENALEGPTLAALSEHCGYSPFYCSTQFKNYTGMTLKKYTAKTKLQVAARELRMTGDRLIDIAIRCGYSSHGAFTRAFAAEYSYTPVEYRRQYGQRGVIL